MGRLRIVVAFLVLVSVSAADLAWLPSVSASTPSPLKGLPVDFLQPMEPVDSAGEFVPPPVNAAETVPSSTLPTGIDALESPALEPTKTVAPSSPPLVAPGTEVADMATEFSTTVAGHEAGEYQTTFSTAPVRFRGLDGAWHPIDTTLVPGEGWRPQSVGPFELSFARSGGGDLGSIRLPSGETASYRLEGARPVEGAVSGSKLVYDEILPSVRLELSAEATGMKEDIVLKTPAAATSFVFPLELGGLTASLASSGDVEYRNAAGDVLLSSPAPWAADADGVVAPSDDVFHELVTSATGEVAVRTTLSRSWLDAPARAFPVTVDPLWSVGAQYSAAYHNAGGYENPASVKVGKVGWSAGAWRSVDFFPYESLFGKVVTDASLHLSNLTEGTGAAQTVCFSKATEWGWNSFDWNTAMCANGGTYVDFWGGQVYSQYKWAIDNRSSGWTLAFAHGDENNGYTYKRFNNFELRIWWKEPNLYTPTVDSLSPAGNPALRTRTPLLAATGRDGDNNPLMFQFDVFDTGRNWAHVWSFSDGQYHRQPYRKEVAASLANDSSYYWRVRAYDGGIWSTYGEAYFIADITAPSTPANLRSPTHSAGVASTSRSVRVDWDAAGDATSGVAGYVAALSTTKGADPGSTITTTMTSQTITAPSDGTFWFNVKTLDAAGNPSGIATFGPVYIDTTAPAITKTVTAAASGTGVYDRGEQVTYTINVRNTNSFPVTINQVADSLPSTLAAIPGTALVSGEACGSNGLPTCTLTAQQLTTSSFSLAAAGSAGDQRSFTFHAVALGSDRDCANVPNVASVTNNVGTTNATSTIAVCSTGLGLERWWSYVSNDLGPQARSSVNPANGNLVVQAVDATPVQAHGRMAFVLRRTYNSKNTTVADMPGSWGAGWQLNVGHSDDLVASGIGGNGISIPSAESFLTPAPVTLTDRDGTRHVFAPNALAAPARVNVTTGLAASLDALVPKVLAAGGRSICVDQTYTAPAGVHLGLWRYISVNSTGADACSATAPASPVVLGFAAVRADRVRSEFDASGRLLSMMDGAGNELRYTYDTSGRLTRVHEPRNCPTNGPACRQIVFTHLDADPLVIPPRPPVIEAVDSAGRKTTYEFDTATPRRLVRVVNPDGSDVRYTYGSACGAGANQLCGVTDARATDEAGRHSTTFTYDAPPSGVPGPKYVKTVTDRRNTTTTFAYHPSYVTADTAGQRQRFQSIDSVGRVGEIHSGDTADMYRGLSLYRWDNTSAACRQPDATVDNNLCQLTRRSLTTATPDEDTTYAYNAEGGLLVERRASAAVNGAAVAVTTTHGYRTQYVQARGSHTTCPETAGTGIPVNCFTDIPAGNGAVNSTGPTSGRGDAETLYVFSDRTHTLSPRGNEAGAATTAFQITFKLDNDARKAPYATSGSCATPAAPSGNTGMVCESDAPAPTGAGRAVTRHTYDSFGQRATTASPKAVAEAGAAAPAVTRYTYYGDTDLDLSGGVSAGGWLKAVTDPHNQFAVFAYDRAGNVARSWDRDATAKAGVSLTSYPGSVSSPPSNEYTEELRASGAVPDALAKPWRYLMSDRDQLGGRVTYERDRNGNAIRTTSARGNAAKVAGDDAIWHVEHSYDAGDLVVSTLLPENNHPTDDGQDRPTRFGYDARGNLAADTDPLGNARTHAYDSVDRRTSTSFTRNAWPSDTTTVPSACRQSAAADAPLPAGRVLCVTSIAYDGVDNVIATTDADGQVATYIYDGTHRRTRTLSPRGDAALTSRLSDGTTTTLTRVDTVYDADGNATTICSPRQFSTTEGNSADCLSQLSPTPSVFAEHREFDPTGRAAKRTIYRAAGQPQVETYGYDANGNRTRVTNARDKTATTSYDLLDRRIREEIPRLDGVNLATTWEYTPSGDVKTVLRPGAQRVGTGSDGDLIVDGSQYPAANPFRNASGKDHRNIELRNGGWIAGNPGELLDLRAAGTITVCATCGITVAGRGHAGGVGGPRGAAGGNGFGPGAGQGGTYSPAMGSGGGGAGHAASGWAGNGPATLSGGAGGSAYGATDAADTLTTAYLLGSGGGGGGASDIDAGGAGGTGGGAVHLTANHIVVRGRINGDATAGGDGAITALTTTAGGGGGGSGGTIWLTAPGVDTTGGTLSVAPGPGGRGVENDGASGTHGGDGSDGRVYVDADTSTLPAGRRVARITAYAYDAKHRLTTTVDGADDTTIDTAGVTSGDGGANIRTEVRYDADDHIVARFEPRAFAASKSADPTFMARTTFDRNGRPTATYTPRYTTTSGGHDDPTGGLTGAQAADCATTNDPAPVHVAPSSPAVPDYPSAVGVCLSSVAYDHAGRVTTQFLPTAAASANRNITIAYTDDNLPEVVTAPSPAADGARVDAARHLYDGSGRVVKTTEAAGTAAAEQSAYAYYADGLLKSVEEQPAATNTHFTTYTYDTAGNRTTVTDAAGKTHRSVYYADALVEKVIDGGNNTTRYVYDAAGNPEEVYSPSAVAKDATNPSGTPTTNAFTDDNLLSRSLQPIAADGSVRRRTAYGYDAGGRKISQSADKTNADATVVLEAGGTQTLTYYPNDRVATEEGRTGGKVTTRYDAAGNPTAIADATTNVTLSPSYYLDGLERQVGDGRRTVRSTYDGAGRRVGRVDVTGSGSDTTTYRYNDAGLASRAASTLANNTTADLDGGARWTWTYDAKARPAGEAAPNGQTTTYGFKADDTLDAVTVVKDNVTIAAWSYTHDNLRRDTTQTFTGVGAGGATPVTGQFTYAYDDAGRLSAFGDTAATRTLTWDADGNRLAFGAQTFTYNADDSINTATDTTGANTKTYTYNGWGGLADDGCAAYTYDGFDRTTSVAGRTGIGCGPAATATYTYDGADRRRSRTQSGTRTDFAYDGLADTLVSETTPTSDISSVLGRGGEKIAVTKKSPTLTTSYLAKDGATSAANITTVTGTATGAAAVLCTVRLDPFGSPLRAMSGDNPCNTGTTDNKAFYRGARRDQTTGTYQFGSRTYDPTKASFLTPDSYRAADTVADLSIGVDPLTRNRYSYVNGDPINLWDPDGHEPRQLSDGSYVTPPSSKAPKKRSIASRLFGFAKAELRLVHGVERAAVRGATRAVVGAAVGVFQVTPIGVAIRAKSDFDVFQAEGLEGLQERKREEFGGMVAAVRDAAVGLNIPYSVYRARKSGQPAQAAVEQYAENFSFVVTSAAIARATTPKAAPSGAPNTARAIAEIGPAGNPGALRLADHHVMPQKFRPFFESKGINIDDFTVSIPHRTTHLRGVHGRGMPLQGMPGRWNPRWAEWIDANPNASPLDVFQQTGRMMDDFGLGGNSIHPYGKG